MPLISVIMTFYNEPVSLLKRSVESILSQTLNDFEFVIVAGNPENFEGIRLLREYASKDSKVVFIVYDTSLRMTVCLNRAIQLAKGEFIAIQEADDESLPSRLEKEYEVLMLKPEIDVAGAAIAYINESDKSLLAIRYYPENDMRVFNRYAAVAHPTIFLKKSVFEKYGYYSESDEVRNSPDYELWFRWCIQGVKFYNIQEVLFNYYQSDNNGRNKNAKKTLLSVIRLKKKYAAKMEFGARDYMFLFLEQMLALFPQKVISKLFYVWVKYSRR